MIRRFVCPNCGRQQDFDDVVYDELGLSDAVDVLDPGALAVLNAGRAAPLCCGWEMVELPWAGLAE